MHLKETFAAWLLAILFISQIICDVKAAGGSSSSSSGGSSSSSSGGSSSGGGGSVGNRNISMGTNMTFAMNGMSGFQLPFPFFPPFGCDLTCQPMQFQVFQQQQVQETVTQPPPSTTTTTTTTTQEPTTRAPTTTPPPKPTSPPQRPSQTTTTFTSQTVIMYPNWCQGWCRFFYQPPPPPVYYQPNCLLFSWMGMGAGMSMGMQTIQS